MGTLRSTQTAPIAEGSGGGPAATGHTFNGVLLGEPVEIDGNPETWEWDDSAFPNGECEVVDGELVVTPDEADPA